MKGCRAPTSQSDGGGLIPSPTRAKLSIVQRFFKMVARFLDFLYDGENSALRWLIAFLLVFVIASLVYLILLTPLVIIGSATYDAHIPGAIGCGIGTAIVNATALTFLQ